MSPPPRLQVAHWVPVTEAEGPGRRFALWLQGCPLRCPGCCNPEMLPTTGGEPIAVPRLTALVLAAAEQHQIEGITLLGGEPTAQASAAATLARNVQRSGLSVMLFTGFTLEELRARRDPAIEDLLAHTDLVIDGPYLRDQPEPQRRWIGSANQRIHCLTERYRADEACWSRPNTLELRLVDGQLWVNGFPAAQAAGLWRRPPKPRAGAEPSR